MLSSSTATTLIFVSAATPKKLLTDRAVRCGAVRFGVTDALGLLTFTRTIPRHRATLRTRESITRRGPNYESRCPSATNWTIVHYTRKDTHTHRYAYRYTRRPSRVGTVVRFYLLELSKEKETTFPFFFLIATFLLYARPCPSLLDTRKHLLLID